MGISLSSFDCCHPSDRAAADADSYTCPDCGSVWTRYPFMAASERVQRMFRNRELAPAYFWSCTTHRTLA